MNLKRDSATESRHPHTEPQQKVADLWMLAILIIFFWPFLLIDCLLERVFRRGKGR